MCLVFSILKWSRHTWMNWSPKLKYRSFGKTDLKVSEIVLAAHLIGYTTGFEDDKACIDCVRKAIDAGLNFFDTSPVYGKSEINLGSHWA